MNQQKSSSSRNHSRHSSGSEIEEVSLDNLSDLDLTLKASESCPQLVNETESSTHKHFDLFNSKKQKVMKLRFKKDLKVRIKSNCIQRQQLDNIESDLKTFSRIPDWGYGQADQRFEEGPQGWENFLELIQHSSKYQMAENLICERHVEKKMEKEEMLRQVKIQALKKRYQERTQKGIVQIIVDKRKEKSKHELLLEDLEKLNQEQSKAINYLKMHQTHHENRKEAENKRQLSIEQKYQSNKLNWFQQAQQQTKPQTPKGLLRLNELKQNGNIKSETPQKLKLKPGKIIIRKSAPQQIRSRLVKQTKVEELQVNKIEDKVVSKFVKDNVSKYRKCFLTPPNIDEIITSASSSTFNRAFGHSVQPSAQRNFSDVNQRTFSAEKSEENDCPFDFAIEDIEEEDKEEESPLKLTKQKSSDTILQNQGWRTQNMSRNTDKEGIAIKHFKRHSLIGHNSPLGETLDFRPRIGHSDSLKPYKPEELIKIYDAQAESSKVFTNTKSRHSTKPSTTGSVRACQNNFKQIIRNKARENKQIFQMLKEKRESIKPLTEAAPVRFSEPLPFSFTPKHHKQNLFPSLQSNTELTTPRVSIKGAKLYVPLSKINFTTESTVLASSRR